MKARGLRYTGIDFQEKFIKRAKTLYPDVDARIANATEIPFPDHSFHTAYAKDLFEHLCPLGNEPNYQTAIKELWRVCSRLMMLAFFHEPAAETTIYYHPLGFWDNTYSESEIIQFLGGIGAHSIEYRPRIGTLEGGYNYLYLVRRSS
jgi:ubiquinone/menaquinone biosynthesis C-methylase UbiE